MQGVAMACTTKNRLSKSTLLAMLGPPPFGEEEFSSSPTRAFFEKIVHPWEITSFDPMTKIVCIIIEKPSGEANIAVTLPELIA